jgi:hypothetical protein
VIGYRLLVLHPLDLYLPNQVFAYESNASALFWQRRASAGYMREAEVPISAFNALNDKAKEHPLGEEIGRRIMGWITVRF